MKNKMVFRYSNKDYNVIIVKKNNKNTYIRVKDGCVFVTTNYFTSSRSIGRLLRDNYSSICKMIDKYEARAKKDEDFYLFGKKYSVIYGFNELELRNNNIFVKNEKVFNKWLNDYIYDTFDTHLTHWYGLFEENIPVPKLRIRKMSTRWGVCNIKNKTVTLNRELYKYDFECLDYVVIHELSHFIHHDHSKNFWGLVSKYCPNYKEIRKKLRD